MTEQTKLRALALYNWPQNFIFSDNRESVLDLLRLADTQPIKMEFDLGNRKRKMFTVKKNLSAEEILRAAPDFRGFEFCRPIDRNFLDLESDFTLSEQGFCKDLLFAHVPNILSIDKALKLISLCSKLITPQYGFSIVMESFDAITFTYGGGTSTMTNEESRRADDLGHIIRNSLELNSFDRIVDIYELNVLNENHLTRQVFGQTLASWIGGKDRGQLIQVNDRTAVWLVPENVRSSIRKKFFNEGLLEVSV